MNKILAYDVESSGFPAWKNPSGGASQPHIVQLAAILADPDTGKEIASIDLIVRPEGWEIPQDTIDVHGITTEHALDVGIPEKTAVALLLELALLSGVTRVAHNRTFDQRMIRIATKRYFDEKISEAWADKDSHHCSMQMARKFFKTKTPNLPDMYRLCFAMDLDDAHSAMADARACLQVYRYINAMSAMDGNTAA